ncbi:hypothetical protein LP419_05795 [Massilia sp. H-1]|nr:hypothetical protein LP419_05795 [Massilia sp. H-1]
MPPETPMRASLTGWLSAGLDRHFPGVQAVDRGIALELAHGDQVAAIGAWLAHADIEVGRWRGAAAAHDGERGGGGEIEQAIHGVSFSEVGMKRVSRHAPLSTEDKLADISANGSIIAYPCSESPPRTGMHTPHRIVIVAFAPAQMLDITGPLDVFGGANECVSATGKRCAV